jgi:hypothetical protein
MNGIWRGCSIGVSDGKQHTSYLQDYVYSGSLRDFGCVPIQVNIFQTHRAFVFLFVFICLIYLNHRTFTIISIQAARGFEV